MADRVQLSGDVTVGAQPSEAELKMMSEAGVRSVISLRHEGEDMQPISPAQEGQIVERFGMEFANIPVSADKLTGELGERFIDALRRMPKPVYVHCKLGTRAGAMALLELADREGLTRLQVLARAEKLGLHIDARLLDFVQQQVDARLAGRSGGSR